MKETGRESSVTIGKLDVSSSALEKGIEIAKAFLDSLVAPATEEVGILFRESVAFWRFKNQVKVLNKARAYCEANGIAPRSIPLKLLCPLLENASLEEDDSLQEKWAILLSNLADSEQNIQNHVFPSILGQISADEFRFLERVEAGLRDRRAQLTEELVEFRASRDAIEAGIQEEIADADRRHGEASDQLGRFSGEKWHLWRKKQDLEQKLRRLKFTETSLAYRIAAPASIPEEELRGFELANIVRLGLARAVHETYANQQTLEIPVEESSRSGYLRVDFDVDLQSESGHVLTELGELFIRACTEKRHQGLPPHS